MPNGSDKKASFWGEEIDQAAAKQLGLDDKHTVFMMASEAEFVDDLQAIAEKLEEDGQTLMSPHEVIGEIESSMRRVKLPDGFRMVGMSPIDSESPKTYGVVDLTSFNYQ